MLLLTGLSTSRLIHQCCSIIMVVFVCRTCTKLSIVIFFMLFSLSLALGAIYPLKLWSLTNKMNLIYKTMKSLWIISSSLHAKPLCFAQTAIFVLHFLIKFWWLVKKKSMFFILPTSPFFEVSVLSVLLGFFLCICCCVSLTTCFFNETFHTSLL